MDGGKASQEPCHGIWVAEMKGVEQCVGFSGSIHRQSFIVMLACIIHEQFCCNRRSAAATSLRSAGSPIVPSPYCTSTHRGLRAPRADLATRLSDFATNRHE
jgi:hypothetical protein